MNIPFEKFVDLAAEAILISRCGVLNGAYGAPSTEEVVKLYARAALIGTLPALIEELAQVQLRAARKLGDAVGSLPHKKLGTE